MGLCYSGGLGRAARLVNSIGYPANGDPERDERNAEEHLMTEDP
jgi:hypothetical protein